MNITASQKWLITLAPGFLYSSGVRVCRSQIYRAVQRAVSSFIPAWRIFLSGPSAAYTGVQGPFSVRQRNGSQPDCRTFPAELLSGRMLLCHPSWHAVRHCGAHHRPAAGTDCNTGFTHAPSVPASPEMAGYCDWLCGRFPVLSPASIVLHWILWLLGRSCWGYLA